MRKPKDHDERIAAARLVAEWEFGESSFADIVVDAYWQPDAAVRGVEFAREKYDQDEAEERVRRSALVDPEIRRRAMGEAA